MARPTHSVRPAGRGPKVKSYLTSFQNAAFRRQAMNVKHSRNNKTHTPTRTRVFWAGSPIHCR